MSSTNLFNFYLEATEEVSLDSPEREPILSSEPSPAVTPVTPTTLIAPRIESKSMSAPVIDLSSYYAQMSNSLEKKGGRASVLFGELINIDSLLL